MIPTAEELLVQEKVFQKLGVKEPFNLQLSRDTYVFTQQNIKRAMIEFAKLHCIEQAKVISDKARVDDNIDGDSGEGTFWVDKESILNAYSLDNIK